MSLRKQNKSSSASPGQNIEQESLRQLTLAQMHEIIDTHNYHITQIEKQIQESKKIITECKNEIKKHEQVLRSAPKVIENIQKKKQSIIASSKALRYTSAYE